MRALNIAGGGGSGGLVFGVDAVVVSTDNTLT